MRIGMLMASFLAGSLVTAAADARPLQVEDWLNWERAGGPQISPDGSEIIYTRQSVNKYKDRWDSELWIMNADGSRARFLTDGSSAVWAPTGDRIAFVQKDDEGRPQLYIRWMDSEGAVSRITKEDMAPSLISWSPDGQWLAFRARVPQEPKWTIDLPGKPKDADWTAEADVIDDMHYRVDRVGRVSWHTHIFVVPADGGTPRQVTKGDWDVGARAIGVVDTRTPLTWSQDGSEIIFDGQVLEDGEEADPWISHIYAVTVNGGEIRQITSEEGFWANAALSPDGKTLAYSGSDPAETNYRPVKIKAVGVDGSNERTLVDSLPGSMGDLHWDQDGEGLYYTAQSKGTRNIHYKPMNGKVRLVTEGDQLLTVETISDQGVAVGTMTAPHVTRNIYSVRLDAPESLTQLTDLNADILADVDLGDVEGFWTSSSDDTDVQGWIINPPNYDASKQYPMILAIHGGPHGMYGVEYRPMMQFLAARGYVVAYSNPRGSTGYGPEFANAIDNRYPGRRDFDDLMAATDATIQRRSIDTDQLYVQGCSGGGVLTAWTVINTNRFAAAASRCPVINWISFAGQADIATWSQVRFRPYFWEDPELWLKHSPIMHVQKVETPTLLMTGVKDLRTPLAQAEEFYAALKARGVPTKLIVVQDEYHGTSSKPSNMLRTVLYMDKWFGQFGGSAAQEATASGAGD
ncbi:MAG: S9 family peptidase [Rhodothalassiaceae bacterium]